VVETCLTVDEPQGVDYDRVPGLKAKPIAPA
jgi:hypothetical protein